MSRPMRIAAVVGEHLFLLAALGFMIPPVPSEAGEYYPYLRAAPYVALFAAASRLCALSVNRETWPGLVTKILIVVAVGYLVHERAQWMK